MPGCDSGACRAGIPVHAGLPFRSMPGRLERVTRGIVAPFYLKGDGGGASEVTHAEDSGGLAPQDADPAGDPLVRNGISLCALHHVAFDRYFIGIRPDYQMEVREDLLREKDGPTLAHAIQGLHGKSLILPTRKEHVPAAESLLMRYELFRRSSEEPRA